MIYLKREYMEGENKYVMEKIKEKNMVKNVCAR